MVRSFHHLTPDRLQIREGGGCMSVFGLPFFVAGVFMFLVTSVPSSEKDSAASERWAE